MIMIGQLLCTMGKSRNFSMHPRVSGFRAWAPVKLTGFKVNLWQTGINLMT